MNLQTLFAKGWLGNLLAIAAGALLTLAFAPFDIFPLAILSPALLLALWLKVSPRQAFLRGFLFGLGLFGTGVHWVYVSMNNFGNLNAFLSVFFTGIFVAVLSLFTGYTGYCLNRYFPKENLSKIFCAFPAVWLAIEWLRGFILSGFPWLTLGYSQIHSPLKGYAPILSVTGVSLAVLLSSALLYCFCLNFYKKHFRSALSNALLLALLWAVGAGLSFIHWTKPFGQPIKVSLIQGNIPQSLKWDQNEVIHTLTRYTQLTDNHWDSKLIIWPESAVPVILQQATDFINGLDSKAKTHQTSIITGIPIQSENQPSSYYNAVIMIGKGTGMYAKQRLVPFGEYIPFEKIVGKVFDLLQVPMSEFIPGPTFKQPLQVDNLKIASFICYEIAFPQQVLQKDESINLILTVSNDAWFGHSVAQPQHLQMAQMRALELGRPVLSVSNDGITAIINPEGNIQARAPQYQEYVLTNIVQPTHGSTPWMLLNANPILLLMLGLIIFARLKQRTDDFLPNSKPWFGSIYSRSESFKK